MAEKTVLNRNIIRSVPTWTNRELAAEEPNAFPIGMLLAGSVLRGRNEYVIDEKMNVNSGEADLYLCHDRKGAHYVAKVYQRANALKKCVSEKLSDVRSPYVVAPIEYIERQNNLVVILKYYEKGSLKGRRFTLEQLKKVIIPSMNEGLQAIHQHGIIHKDLKPDNIMMADDEKNVAIIDFGISSVLEADHSILLTQTGMTPQYTAPETFNGVATIDSDYYSFGITLYELYFGKLPYEGLPTQEILQYTSIQRLPIPLDVPNELRKLILALTYPGITERTQKWNPNRRWGYDEVKRWLNGENLPIPGGDDQDTMLPFPFNGKEYTNIRELAEALAEDWDNGKKLLFNGSLTKHFTNQNQTVYEACLSAEAEAAEKSGKDDSVFFGFLYKLVPDMKAFCWKGSRFETIEAYGRAVLEALRNNSDGRYELFDSILSEQVLSDYVTICAPENGKLLEITRGIEEIWLSRKNSKAGRLYTYYMMGYLVSGQKVLELKDAQIRTVGELADRLKACLAVSLSSFQQVCHDLFQYDGSMQPELEAWLDILGKHQEVLAWQTKMQEEVGMK